MKKYDFEFHALGTECIISIVNENNNGLNEIVNTCYTKILRFENEFSRFRKDSLLNKINTEKKGEISTDFISLINKSKDIYTFTNGYFNPLIDIRGIGYSHSFNSQIFEKYDITPDLNFNAIKIYGNYIELKQNMNLDFGSIAKGYLAEKISRFLTKKGYKDNLVNIGGDIFASGNNHKGDEWNIGIDSPFSPGEVLESIKISNKSVASSGTYLRYWKIGESNHHHIKNPYSEISEFELVSVSIIHDSGYMSDALATALIAMGKDKALLFAKKHKLKFLFILKEGQIFSNL